MYWHPNNPDEDVHGENRHADDHEDEGGGGQPLLARPAALTVAVHVHDGLDEPPAVGAVKRTEVLESLQQGAWGPRLLQGSEPAMAGIGG